MGPGRWWLAFGSIWFYLVPFGELGSYFFLWEAVIHPKVNGSHYDSLLTASKHFTHYFGLRKELGMEEERSHVFTILPNFSAYL